MKKTKPVFSVGDLIAAFGGERKQKEQKAEWTRRSRKTWC